MTTATVTEFEKKVGHPPGLFVLFFAEMWERFSYYGMRALLVFYMTKGFLGFSDNDAYSVYGAYTSLVYMTPFIGGMIADKLLGARRAVVIGGVLMAAGHMLMTIESSVPFFIALSLLICGNGFFKPNISTIVGSLYGAHNKEKRDGGFTLFYMGINLGAAMAPLLCGYIGETYGWHYGFGLATFGMLIGIAVFVAPTRVTQALIGAGALGAAGILVWKVVGKDWLVSVVHLPITIALVVAAGFAIFALNHGALPPEAGAAPDEAKAKKALPMVLGGTVGAIVIATILMKFDKVVALRVPFFEVDLGLAGLILTIFGVASLAYIVREALRATAVERDRIWVLLIMFFFSMLFWAFFEQAGSSMNLFTDRNVDRVLESSTVTADRIGQTVDVPVSQELLGRPVDGAVFTIDKLDQLRKDGKTTIPVVIADAHVGMGLGGTEVPASEFQAANPTFILLFGLLFSALWTFLARRKIEPSTPAKFAWGLVQLGLGFGALWYGAKYADARGMVGASWLLLAYLLHTTGELCLSPVGLSMVTKLSPARLVSTMMGGWFLATAFSQYLAAIIAALTGVGHGEGDSKAIPAPIDTVNVYGDVFGRIGVASVIAGVLLFAMTPLIKKWMHVDQPMTGEGGAGGH